MCIGWTFRRISALRRTTNAGRFGSGCWTSFWRMLTSISARKDAFRTLVDTQGLGRTDALVPQIIEQVYDKAQCHPEPEVWLDACLAQCEEKDRPEDTVWGKFLLDDARYWLERELEALERCAKEAAAVDGWRRSRPC